MLPKIQRFSCTSFGRSKLGSIRTACEARREECHGPEDRTSIHRLSMRPAAIHAERYPASGGAGESGPKRQTMSLEPRTKRAGWKAIAAGAKVAVFRLLI